MYEHWITLVIFSAGWIACLWFGWSCLAKARIIEDTPTSKIRSASQGYVELIGEARPDQKLLYAPLTGSACLWWSFQIERYERSGKHSTWRTVRRGRSDFSFYLVDGTGQCHIHPDGAEVHPMRKQIWYGHTEVAPSPMGAGGSGVMFGGGRYRYTEARIQEGDLIYALGLFQTVYPPPASVQVGNRIVEILNEWKADHQKLLARFDTDGNGEINQTEWEVARQEAAAVAQEYQLDNIDHEAVHMLCKPPTRRQHFIIANKHPKRLAGGYRWRGWGALAGLIGISWVIYQVATEVLG